MSYPTKQAFTHVGSWDDKSRAHPAMKWMENYTYACDRKAWNTEPASAYLTSDHTLQKSTGEIVSGGDASWSIFREELYAPMSAHCHDPTNLVCWENETGWEMLGVANLWYNLAVAGEGEKVKDKQGKEWDGVIPAAFDFHYVKQGDGSIKLGKTSIYSNPTGAVVGMLKRGMMKPDDLLK
ncbi:hypothetical protein FB567DRAFT_634795 [Paraphoma chrysanthemicola]|uniref:Uncharacterized protein n=1 Tax=Paraphoma chrysanthemicola TaxID=798071 RepID=A0A8K0QT36_9PLEO|nr:hypothetical protein FB567DRAFT_634795 [Paraphoma chrysanthemicola]